MTPTMTDASQPPRLGQTRRDHAKAKADLRPALVLPATFFVALGLLAPLAMLARYSFNRYDPRELMISLFTLENYHKALTDGFYLGVLWRTLWISGLATMICLVAGVPVAYYLSRYATALQRRVLLIVILVPLLVGNAVRTSAWMLILNDKGVLAALLELFGFHGELGLMYTPTAVVIGLISVLLPFMIITLNSVFEGIDPTFEEAGQSLGASHLTLMRRVVLPLALPGLLAGAVLCFTLSMNAYATPTLLGGPTFNMMAPTVYQQISKVMNWPFGAALAFVMMATTLLVTLAVTLFVQRKYRRWSA